jgi:hypothetical protein
MSSPNEQTFLIMSDFMFDINMVNGIEFRPETHSRDKIFIVFKNNCFITKDCSYEKFQFIREEFLKLLKTSTRLNILDYIVFETVIFSIVRLTVIEYRNPSNGLKHLIQFKDGQYLLPYLTQEKFQELFKLVQITIQQKERTIQGI